MGLIGILLLVVFVISAIMLILVVMVQDEQGEGLGGIFGGGSSSAFGPRSGNVLTRFTSVLAALFLLTAFGLAFINRTPASEDLLQRVRAEQLRDTENGDWWVEVEPDESESDAAGAAGGEMLNGEQSAPATQPAP